MMLLPRLVGEDSSAPPAAILEFDNAGAAGSTASEAEPRVNIVVASGEEGSSLLDPLNVIPDQYEGEYAEEEADYLADYNDYDPADIPPDQAEIVEDLSSYVGNDLGSVDDSESLGAAAGPAPAPAFDDLRGISFTTGGLSALSDPEPTTYRSPIDFDFGTTAAEGIEVGDVVLREEDGSGFPGEYEVEEETDYAAGGQDIPIVVEEAVTEESALPTYDPVVLLVGTPEKVRSTIVKFISRIQPIANKTHIANLTTIELAAGFRFYSNVNFFLTASCRRTNQNLKQLSFLCMKTL